MQSRCRVFGGLKTYPDVVDAETTLAKKALLQSYTEQAIVNTYAAGLRAWKRQNSLGQSTKEARYFATCYIPSGREANIRPYGNDVFFETETLKIRKKNKRKEIGV